MPFHAVLVLERVERVRIGGDDGPVLRLGESLQVLVPEHLEEALLADAADVVAGVALGLVEEAEVEAGLGEDLRRLPGDLLAARVVGGVVADEPEILHRLLAGVLDLEAGALDPPGAHPVGLAEGIAVAGEVREHVLHRALHRALADEVAAERDDERDLFVPDRAAGHAGHAGGAGPQLGSR